MVGEEMGLLSFGRSLSIAYIQQHLPLYDQKNIGPAMGGHSVHGLIGRRYNNFCKERGLFAILQSEDKMVGTGGPLLLR
jgi:hypothetical protein